jgi:hypothetical protein
MVPLAAVSNPRTGARIEVFYADRSLETFGRCGAGWFWWPRRRGFSPDGLATGPFPTSYSAYRNALEYGEPQRARRSIGISVHGNAGSKLVGEKRENVSRIR